MAKIRPQTKPKSAATDAGEDAVPTDIARGVGRRAADRQRAKAQESSQAKTRFLAIASHEMRTPLNGILGMSKLLAETGLTPEQQAYNQAIRNSGEALFALVEDILDITKIESGRFTLQPEPVAVEELIEDVCELLATRAHEKDIELTAIAEPDLPRSVVVDRARLRQILLNLVGNAIKYTCVGGVVIRAHRRQDAEAGRECLAFSVTDTGPGIRTEDQARIFEEFEQADLETVRRHGGAGLGLTISRSIIEHMGGRIQVDSEPGRGSRFTAILPFEPAPDATQPSIEDEGLPADNSTLIVSPSVVGAPVIAEMIWSAGGTAIKTAEAAEAAALAAANAFDTVIVDEAAGPSPGAVMDMIAKTAAPRPRAIVLLRPSGRSRLEDHLQFGFDGYLIRPLRRKSLLRVLAGHPPLTTPEPAGEAGGQSAHPAPTNGSPLAILLAEDNPVNALLARSVLCKAGHQVVTVHNGAEAIDQFATYLHCGQPFDAVFMDLHMPMLDGIAAIRCIRETEREIAGAHETGSARTPIVALSADEQEDTREEALAAGADAFITKPVDPQHLTRIVEELADPSTA